MKSVVFFLVVLCALIIGSVPWVSKASNATGKQQGITQFNRPVVLQGVTLQGEYLFVHDDAAMQRGEACTYVYKGTAPVRSRLVVSFHCVHVERTKAARFMIRSVETAAGIVEVREFQFAGDTAAHAVPTSVETHVVPTSVP
jgi:hypothetical protein